MAVRHVDPMTQARAMLVVSSPFFATLALRLKLTPMPGIGTAFVDGVTLVYDPEWVNGLSQDQRKGLLAHEAMHCALAHHARSHGRDHDTWNVACDHAIDPLLVEAGFQLPSGAHIAAEFKGQAAEQIYTTLIQRKQQDDQGQGTGTGQGKSQGQGGEMPQQGGGTGQQHSDPGGNGGVEPYPGDGDGQDGNPQTGQASPAEMERQAAEWKMALASAAQVAKARGQLPASLASLIEAELQPKADWRALLRAFFARNLPSDFAMIPPNRRFVHMGLYLPSIRRESMGPVVVAIDTSGSIGDAELAQFGGEMGSILEDCQPERVHAVYCDARVNHVDEMEPGQPFQMRRVGGGGTDFRPVFDWVEAEGITPAALVYLTDLHGPAPQREPGYPVLWACTSTAPEPWGQRVDIDMR